MAHEAHIISRWLESVLGNDASLTSAGFGPGRVFRRMAKQDTPLPYIVFAMEPGASDENAAGARHLANTRHSVRIMHDTTKRLEDYEDALNRIETILEQPQGEREGHLLTVRGAGMLEGEEIEEGRTVRFQGRMWLISAEKVES